MACVAPRAVIKNYQGMYVDQPDELRKINASDMDHAGTDKECFIAYMEIALRNHILPQIVILDEGVMLSPSVYNMFHSLFQIVAPNTLVYEHVDLQDAVDCIIPVIILAIGADNNIITSDADDGTITRGTIATFGLQ